MKRIPLLLAVIVVGLGGFVFYHFSQQDSEGIGSSGPSAQMGDILSYVPADTLYYFGGLEPVPVVSMLQGAITEEELNAFQAKLLSQPEETQAYMDTAIALIFGLGMEYLAIESTPERLSRELGVGTHMYSVAYTVGTVPVFRLKLENEAVIAINRNKKKKPKEKKKNQ